MGVQRAAQQNIIKTRERYGSVPPLWGWKEDGRGERIRAERGTIEPGRVKGRGR